VGRLINVGSLVRVSPPIWPEFRDSHSHATLDLPDRLVVVASERLETAGVSRVENAVEPNPVPAPRVRIERGPSRTTGGSNRPSATTGRGSLRTERGVGTRRAEITAVRHSSGLGLRLVKWTVERFGGGFGVAEGGMGGNRVRVRLRRAADEGS
jgi:hypothetical protein